jgi:prepilin-type N-terminal cleavage/methylation domain-containing protein
VRNLGEFLLLLPKMQKSPRIANRGVSLIEIIVVMVILSVLAVIIIPRFLNARVTAGDIGCYNNLRVLYGAAMQYISERNGRLPDMVYWREDDPRYMEWSLIPYVYGIPEKRDVIQMKASVFSCPVAQNDPVFHTTAERQRLNVTYGINVFMHGTNESGGSISNYAEWKQKNPVAWNIHNVQRPNEAPLFLDGSVISDNSGVRYSVYQNSGRVKPDPGDKPPSGAWQTPFLHSRKRINVIFMDGRVSSLQRTPAVNMNWSGRD